MACFATQGTGHGDDARIRALLSPLGPRPLPFDRAHRLRSGLRVARKLTRERPDVVVLEGTGVAGGLAVLAARLAARVPYVVSSGDAVGPFIAARHPWLRPVASAYERLLLGASSGVIGWSPYLAGRALTYGSPRAMTAAGWAEATPGDGAARAATRRTFGLREGGLVFGIVGTLIWNPRVSYCYGMELVQAARRIDRSDVQVLVVGDGDGRRRLEAAAGDRLGDSIVIPGPVPRADVPDVLAAMDVGSLPQSVDGVGAFRYTTKLSEYLAAGLPVVTGQIPLAYDLEDGWLWRLPGRAPWDPAYVAALASLMGSLSREEVARRRRAVPRDDPTFSRERQIRHVCDFILDVAAATGSARRPRSSAGAG